MRASSYCNTDTQTGNCLKVGAHEGSDRLLIQDSELNDLPLVTTRKSFEAFINGVKAGEFDDLV